MDALGVAPRRHAPALARKKLRQALKANRHVVKYLCGAAECPHVPVDAYALGSEEEAIFCAQMLGAAWEAASGALPWLRTNAGTKIKPRRRRRR